VRGCNSDTAYLLTFVKGGSSGIFAREHTGLLKREVREELENRFLSGNERFHPNLLSATSTLEMGIDIGDLSSVLLCAIPPTQANYQQRVGRAGRRDGNALITAIANGKPHDLYFWAEPLNMIDGAVQPPDLDAAAILQRQLTAFCLDRWVGSAIKISDLPDQLDTVLNNIQKENLQIFPYTLTRLEMNFEAKRPTWQ
jgi:DEAD/DEAH box helicase domain-containing protein